MSKWKKEWLKEQGMGTFSDGEGCFMKNYQKKKKSIKKEIRKTSISLF